jgi:protein-S-isoprenylcysteine O-methyltransferase Ste14
MHRVKLLASVGYSLWKLRLICGKGTAGNTPLRRNLYLERQSSQTSIPLRQHARIMKMKRSSRVVTVIPLAAIALLLLEFASRPWTVLRILGLVVTIGASAALTMARLQLGNSFTILPEANELVTRGIYSKVRNPIYVFSAIAIAGLLLYLNRLRLFWIFLIVIPLQIVRARKEGRVLEERFGEEYRQYKARTWF